MRVDTDAIRQLAEILQETGLTEIEVSDKDCRIRVARAPAVIQAAVAAAPVAAHRRARGRRRLRPGRSRGRSGQAPRCRDQPDGGYRLSRDRSLGSPSYVAIGQSVTAGQTLLLIEAMKTFNQIKAPRAGTVSQILIASGVPVEYGEVLMVID